MKLCRHRKAAFVTKFPQETSFPDISKFSNIFLVVFLSCAAPESGSSGISRTQVEPRENLCMRRTTRAKSFRFLYANYSKALEAGRERRMLRQWARKVLAFKFMLERLHQQGSGNENIESAMPSSSVQKQRIRKKFGIKTCDKLVCKHQRRILCPFCAFVVQKKKENRERA